MTKNNSKRKIRKKVVACNVQTLLLMSFLSPYLNMAAADIVQSVFLLQCEYFRYAIVDKEVLFK